MRCGICGKELHKGDTAYEGKSGRGWGYYPIHTSLFCSKECAEKNGQSDAKNITIERTDEEWKETMQKGIQALKDLGFTFPSGGFPFESKDKALFEESSNDTILLAKLPK